MCLIETLNWLSSILGQKSELAITGIDLISPLLYLILPIPTRLFQPQRLFCSLNLSSPFPASLPFVLVVLSAERILFSWFVTCLLFILQVFITYCFSTDKRNHTIYSQREFNMINECLYCFWKDLVRAPGWTFRSDLKEPKNTTQNRSISTASSGSRGVRKPRSQMLASGCTSVAVSRAWEMGLSKTSQGCSQPTYF